ncbi:TPA: hypothetical protein ACSTJZ_001755 [Serratia fonticola]|uniref:FaeA-like protein n=1 Tax=Serratia fonticola TaxID=47917 RepID=A0A4U9TKS5_SERFO|nr:hypothetical protein [Serratia fonticola]CAI1914086.1 Uncharacterised protein [Serratia fonticola]VTR20650.1 Uncharacterised protein [Serratia fonticola]
MAELKVTRRESLRLQHALLIALQQLAPSVTNNRLPPQTSWPSTRQLAMALDIGIYRARYLLLDMVRKNHVVVSNSAVNNSLRWFPIEKTIPSPADNSLPDKVINK